MLGADIPSFDLRGYEMQLCSDGLIKFTDERAQEHVKPLFEKNPDPISRQLVPAAGVLPADQFVTALPAAFAANAGIVFNGKRNRGGTPSAESVEAWPAVLHVKEGTWASGMREIQPGCVLVAIDGATVSTFESGKEALRRAADAAAFRQAAVAHAERQYMRSHSVQAERRHRIAMTWVTPAVREAVQMVRQHEASRGITSTETEASGAVDSVVSTEGGEPVREGIQSATDAVATAAKEYQSVIEAAHPVINLVWKRPPELGPIFYTGSGWRLCQVTTSQSGVDAVYLCITHCGTNVEVGLWSHPQGAQPVRVRTAQDGKMAYKHSFSGEPTRPSSGMPDPVVFAVLRSTITPAPRDGGSLRTQPPLARGIEQWRPFPALQGASSRDPGKDDLSLPFSLVPVASPIRTIRSDYAHSPQDLETVHLMRKHADEAFEPDLEMLRAGQIYMWSYDYCDWAIRCCDDGSLLIKSNQYHRIGDLALDANGNVEFCGKQVGAKGSAVPTTPSRRQGRKPEPVDVSRRYLAPALSVRDTAVLQRSAADQQPLSLAGDFDRANPVNEPGSWDAMISYTQRNAASETLAEALYGELTRRGFTVWLDVKMNKRDVAAMEEGVKFSRYVIAIVSGEKKDGDAAYFNRPLCLKELRWAMEAEVPVQPVVTAEDKGKITEFFELIPEDLKRLEKLNWIHIDRKENAYFEVGVNLIIEATQ